MSAKRLKMPSKNRAPRGSRIPIPSFGIAPTAVSPHPQPAATRSENTAKHIPSWNKDHLIHLESALQLYNSRQKVANSSSILPLADLYALASKLSLEPRPLTTSLDNTDLNEQERLLLDLLCVTSPVLYQLRKIVNTEERNNGWCLETLPSPGNRITELHRLFLERSSDPQKEDSFLQAIREHRNERQQPHKPAAAVVETTTALPDNATTGTNVEDRVRARAHAKRNYQETYAQENKNNTNDKNTTVDRAWLARLADGLWSHASDILLRQARFQSAGQPKPKICTLTLKDVVAVLQQSIRSETVKLSKRRIVEGILELRRIVPEWIELSGDDTNIENLSKDTTVWLKPHEYRTIRCRLTGQQSKLPLRKHSLEGLAASTTAKRSKPSPPTKESVASLEGQSEQLTNKSLLGSSTQVHELLSSPPEEDTKPALQKSKKRWPLRVNKNLILTDADHVGGEIIPRTAYESPRGLKRLFEHMKAGKRI
jgi:hypothetical protein